jgi:uncharacterized protein
MRNSTVCQENDELPIDDFTDAAPAYEPSVVHSSYGRLRVHLPFWLGTRDKEIAAAVECFPGVTHAEANAHTGNLLIVFKPDKTSTRTLLEALPALRLPAPPPIRLVEEVEPSPTEATHYMTGLWRRLYLALGWGSVGMAVVGAITPGIPTAPFVILAGYFFVRSSPEAHQWLRESAWFGGILRDWEEHRGVRRSIRNVALALIAVGMAVTLWLGLPMPLTASIVAMQILGIVIIMSLHVVDAEEPEPAADVLKLHEANS